MCATDLGIPDIIHNHGQPISLSQLISALSIHPTKTHCIHRLMRILVHSGFFAQQKSVTEEEVYELTNASQLLLKDHPLSVAPFLVSVLDPILTKPWHHLSAWFQNHDPTPFNTAHGMTLWEFAGHDPKLNHFFNDAMASDARLIASVVIEKCKGIFKGLGSLVDVGGGTGTLAKAIAKEFPLMDCTVLDLPHAVAGLQGSQNLKYVGGDMFDGVPSADAVLLKWVLHNWTDEECVEILKKCREAITRKSSGKKGKVIIIDIVMENEKANCESVETQLLSDMLMMVLITGKERNEKEWAKLTSSAGFTDYKISPVLGFRSLIEVFP